MEATHRDGEAGEAPQGAGWTGWSPFSVLGMPLAGAPLDIVKLAAAVFMLGDHINTVLLQGAQPLMWRFGRIAFPLFCFVAACHLLRGADPRRYLSILLVSAAATQPIFAIAFRGQLGNVLFTLAAGIAIAAALPHLRPLARHAVLATAPAVALAAPVPAVSGVDFGLAGMLFPAAVFAALRFGPSYLPWLVIFVFTLNAPLPRPAGEAWWFGPLLDGLFAGVGSLAVVAIAALFRGKPRFLPRFALHLFYPGHLAALAAIRALL